ncbi:peptidoglycan-binding protein [Streptomyces sp. IBSNAI002]|uniref:peptidoglycan-binding protein n=1 Tax=Streptomyces sp. IBSNAI002 TaxID=3457500 RepID=UPI003FCEE848
MTSPRPLPGASGADPNPEAGTRSHRDRRRPGRRAVLLGAFAAVLTVGGVTAAALGRSEPKKPAGPAGTGHTAVIERSTLTAAKRVQGGLGYGGTREVTAQAPGTLTAQPEAGSVLEAGKALYSVDNSPVVLLSGAVPAWREMARGTEGPDVRQLQQNLRALGYDGAGTDGTYGAGTEAAVRRWQKRLKVQETGRLAFGAVVFSEAPARVGGLKQALGAQLQPGAVVLTVTATAQQVRAELDAGDRSLAAVGAAATVTLPDGRTLKGKVTAVSPVTGGGQDGGKGGSGGGSGGAGGGSGGAGGGEGGGSQEKLAVDIALDDGKDADTGSYGEAPVKVDLVGERKENVLHVPVTALVAAGEGYGVRLVSPAGTARTVPVETGLFASGRVEVSGEGLEAGQTVEVPAP